MVGFIGLISLLHQVSLQFSLRLLLKPLTTLWLVAEAVVETLVLAAVVLDGEDRFRFANPAAANAAGSPPVRTAAAA